MKAKSRVRDCPMTWWRNPGKLEYPASPASTPVVVAVSPIISSAGRPMRETWW